MQQLKRVLANPRFRQVLGLYLLLWFGLQLMQVVALIWLVQVVHVPANLSTWISCPSRSPPCWGFSSGAT